jgi:hypothetical protein
MWWPRVATKTADERAAERMTMDYPVALLTLPTSGRIITSRVRPVKASAMSDDELVAALLEALDGFGEPELVAAKYNSGELRIPGHHEGGGRWTAGGITKAIAKALEDWSKGDGPDDPFTLDGKPIDREPLRKAAVARGITLKRGAPREDIVKALLDDVRSGAKAKKADAPSLPGAPKDHRRFTIQLGGKVDPAAVREVEVENRIRAAYREAVAAGDRGYNGFAVRPGVGYDAPGVRLSAIRQRIGDDIPRSEVDDALRRLSRQGPDVFVGPDENQKTLTVADREAEIIIGNQRQNMLTLYNKAAEPQPLPKPSGTATDVGIFGNPSTGKLSLYRESDTGKKSGRAIKSFDDMGQLESWARDNGHTELADYAKAEQAKTAPKTAAKGPLAGEDALKATAVNPTGDQLAAVTRMGGDGAYVVNDDLRANKGNLESVTPKNRATAEAMDSLMKASPLKHDIVVHRKLGNRNPFDTSTGPEVDPLNRDLAGFTWTEPGYSSTDIAGKNLEHRGIALRITVPAGTPAISHKELDNGEVLLPRGLTFKVTKDNGGFPRHLDVEVVPAKAEHAGGAPSAPAAKKAAPAEGAIPTYSPPASLTAAEQQRAAQLVRRDPQIFAKVHDRGGPISTSGNLSNGDAAWLQSVFEREPAFVNHLAQTEQINRQLRADAKKAGETLAAYKAKIAAQLKDVVADKPVAVRVTNDGLRGILSGGRFKTSFDTGAKRAPGLHVDVAHRRLGEQVNGIAPDTPPEKRPVYGYVAINGIEPALFEGKQIPLVRQREGQEDVLSAYGKVQVVLKPSVRERTSVTVGDSLDELGFMRPSPIDNPSAESVGFRDHERLAQPSFTRTGYVEAQIHGGVSASDIAEVVFPDQPSAETAKALDSHGISWRVLRPGDKPTAPVTKAAPDPAAILASLPADLTPAQKRARLRSRGVSKEQIDALVPLAPRKRTTKAVKAAAGHDVTPGHDELHHYWVEGKGRRLWADSLEPWRTLHALVTAAVRKNGRAVSPEEINNWVSRWFFEVKGYYAGSDLNRVAHGHPPRGKVVGPG